MYLKRIFSNLVALTLVLSVLCLPACSDDDEASDAETEENVLSVVAFYPPQGLGDLSFVDGVYRGVETAINEHDLYYYFYVPEELEAGCEQLCELIKTQNYPGKTLFLVLGAEYEEAVRSCSDTIGNNKNVDVVLIETRSIIPNVSTVYISLYGVLYEASHLVASMDDVKRSAIVSALPGLAATDDAEAGFRDGPFDVDSISTVYLSDDFDGFNMSDSLYRMSYQLNETYDLVVPLCGGSIQGLLRYNREFPETSFYSVGMDADMSVYASRVPFSCVKRGGDVAARCIEQWLAGEMPQYQFFGLEDGFTRIELADDSRSDWVQLLSEIESEAIEKEKAYEESQQ